MEAAIFVGIQGSGKTTFYRERLLETHVRISMDLLRTRQREALFIRTCLASGQRFAIDNTNPRVADRAGYIHLAKAAGFRVVGYFFETRLRDALRRNAARAGKRAIPIPGVAGTFKRLEPPTPAEGFDELYTVRLEEGKGFTIEPWQAPQSGAVDNSPVSGASPDPAAEVK
jgi:hypothetical protein